MSANPLSANPLTSPWAALALAAGTLFAGVVAPDREVEPAVVVEVVAKRGVFSLPAAPTVGTGFIGGGELFARDGTTRIGEGYSHCGVVKLGTEVPPVVTAHCTSAFRLEGGELHLSSLRTYRTAGTGFEDTSLAIVGGTGEYANARGDGRSVRDVAQTDVTYRFTFNVITQ